MTRSLLLFALLFDWCQGSGQSLAPLIDPRLGLGDGSYNVFILEGLADYNANTVYNELPLALRNGGFIERDLRQRTSDALTDGRNALGYLFESRLEWRGAPCIPHLPSWRPMIAVAFHDLAGTRFTKDQYDLAFFGNSAYQNRSAILAPSAFEQVRYQTAGAGLQHHPSGSFIRLDLVRGQSLSAVDVRWASLFTGEDGRVVRTSLLGDYIASDTSGGGLDRTNGSGASFSGRWNYRLPRTDRPWTVSIGLDDLGFVVWNANTVNIEKDTVIRYTGWDVPNLFAVDDALVNEETVLDTFGLRYAKGEAMRLLPFRVTVSLTTLFDDRWSLGVGLEHRHLPGFIPQITGLASYLLSTRCTLGATIGYGGFGAWRFGLSARHRFGRHFLAGLSTPQVHGFLFGRARGLGLMADLTFAF